MLEELEIQKAKKYFLTVLAMLVALGLIMVYSASYMYAKEKFGTSLYFISRQLFFLVLGTLAAFIVSKTKVSFWLKYSVGINIFFTLFLLLTFIPGLGVIANGANRWLKLGGFSLQPGEFVKFSLILASASYFEQFNQMVRNERIAKAFFLLLPLAVFLSQPDFGSFVISLLAIIFVCFLSSFSRKYFYLLLVGGIMGTVISMFARPYRVTRLMTYLDPWANPKGSGFQIIQSWIGFANGGFFGKGPGNSIEKLFYLPEAHNDFIFSVIGEEFGFLGVLILVLLFLSFIYFGFFIAMALANGVRRVVVASIVFVISIQALLNMGVVLGLLPTKGLNLPFISSGGSALMASLFGIGILFSCSRFVDSGPPEGNYAQNTITSNLIDKLKRQRLVGRT